MLQKIHNLFIHAFVLLVHSCFLTSNPKTSHTNLRDVSESALLCWCFETSHILGIVISVFWYMFSDAVGRISQIITEIRIPSFWNSIVFESKIARIVFKSVQPCMPGKGVGWVECRYVAYFGQYPGSPYWSDTRNGLRNHKCIRIYSVDALFNCLLYQLYFFLIDAWIQLDELADEIFSGLYMHLSRQYESLAAFRKNSDVMDMSEIRFLLF